MCMNIHRKNGNVNSIGMIRVKDTMPATKAVEIVIKKLGEFGLQLKNHIIAVITDGSSVMKKMGRLMGIYHQICHSHGIHLAVLHANHTNLVEPDDEYFETELDNSSISDEYDDDDDDDEEDFEKSEGQSWLEVAPANYEIEFVQDFSSAINKIRKIAHFFRKSPVKNDFLQRECQEKLRKEKVMIIDIRTRWNSMLAMLKRFLELKEIIKSVLINLSVIRLYPTNCEIKQVEEIVESLEIIEVNSLALGRRDCNIIDALKIFEFLLSKLKTQSSETGMKFYEAVSKKIFERRIINVEGLLEYLDDPNTYLKALTQKNAILKRSTVNEIALTIKEIVHRLFLIDENVNENSLNREDEATYECTENITKKEELNCILSKKNTNVLTVVNFQNNVSSIKKEMSIFEKINKRSGSHLFEQMYNALLTIPPSSVEAEKCFSAAGLFVTKLRTSLNDETIDLLCFLRSYLLQKQNGHEINVI